MSLIPDGICVDLETTIAGKVPDAIRPSGQKRYETRIIEVGAVNWKEPDKTFGCLVNPIPIDVQLTSADDLYKWLTSIYQKPDATINFWSRVLVQRNSVSSEMFRHDEPPSVWLRRTPRNKAVDFVHWHHHPSDGPKFVSEEKALMDLICFSEGQDWLAHNGKSFDFKVLEGCALRTGLPIPSSIRQHDTLHLFRKMIPGYASYSQPKLYGDIFGQKYNAHVAIDDAIALSELCRHVHGSSASVEKKISDSVFPVPKKLSVSVQNCVSIQKRKMNLTFGMSDGKAGVRVNNRGGGVRNRQTRVVRKCIPQTLQKCMPQTLRQIKGIGPKSVAALAAISVTSVAQLKEKVEKHGEEWLRENLPFGVKWREVSRTII